MKTDLMLPVERIVRPINAPLLKKMRMRSELYAHLECIYTEELARHENPELALESTLKRFGDLGEVRTELQKTVPKWNQIVAWLDRFFTRESRETNLQFAWRASRRIAIVISLLYIALAMCLVDASILGRTIIFFAFLGFVWFGCGVFSAILCGAPVVYERVPLSLTFLLRQAIYFGICAAFIESLTLYVSNYSSAYPDGAIEMTATAFVAGTGMFLIVVALLRSEMNQLADWLALPIED